MRGSLFCPNPIKGENIYFKKDSGKVFKYDETRHDLDSLKERFKECDENGKEKEAKKKAKK